MKEHLRQLAAQAGNDLARGGLVREYLQARILEALQEEGLFLRWAFVGGTALRFLYSIPRFSEDLDFSLIDAGAESGIEAAMARVKRALTFEGYAVDIKLGGRPPVASAWVRFPGLPHELGLSPHAGQALSIKIELDTNPPPGAGIETSIVRRHVTLNLCHHDRGSLLAGKLHAVLSRPWAKGRDLYDLVWYLADRSWPAPNLKLLNAALAQTGGTGSPLTQANWRRELLKRLEMVDWKRAQADVRPFLERAQDIDLVTPEALRAVVQRGTPGPGNR